MGRAVGWVLGAALAGCTLDAGVLAPPEARDESRFLFVDPALLPACGAVAQAILPVGKLPPLVDSGSPALLLEFDRAAFGAWPAGEAIPLVRVRGGSLDRRDGSALPVPFRAWRLSGGGFEAIAPESSSVTELSLAFASREACSARIADRCAVEGAAEDPRCADWATVQVYVPNAQSGGVGLLIGLDENTALAAANVSISGAPARIFRLDAPSGEATEIEQLPERMPHLGAYRAPDGELWIMGPDDRVARGDPSSGFTIVHEGAPTFTGQRGAWIDGPKRAGDPFEIYAAFDDGYFVRFDGSEVLHLNGAEPGTAVERGGVAWIAPGEALAAGARHGQVLRHRGGIVEVVDAPLSSDDEPTAVRHVEGKGTIVGTSRGELLSYDGRAWSRLESPLDGAPIRAILEYEDGLVFASGQVESAGRVTQLIWDSGLCAPRQVSDREIRRLEPRPGGGFLGLAKEAPTAAFVVFAKAGSKYPECN